MFVCIARRLALSLALALVLTLAVALPAVAAPSVMVSWGKLGDGDGEFNAPQGIAIGLGEVFVVESGNQRVQRFRLNGAFHLKWGNPGPGGSAEPGRFSGPEGIATDSDGNVYVADTGNDRIEKFTPEGVLVKSWGTEGAAPGQFSAPTDVAVDGARNVYVADFGNSRVEKFSADGTYLGEWGGAGTGPGQFKWLTGIAAGPAGDVYTVELDNHRVQRFSSSGAFVGAWGSEGGADGQFQNPEGIATGPDGSVYVVDRGRDDVQVFSAAGAFLSRFGSSGSGAGQFQIPVDLAVDARGVVYVVDNDSSRVQAFAERPPETVDTDGDALPDSWELFGLDLNGDGKVDLDLPAMGADSLHKDVFVQLDYLTNHKLMQSAIDRVAAAFASAPVSNPDRRAGINLHVDNGPDSVMNPVTRAQWGALSAQNHFIHLYVLGSFNSDGSFNWTMIDNTKARSVSRVRLRAFHYAISGHRFGRSSNTSGGISRGIGASDFIVALQGWCAPDDCSGTEDLQAVTFMHELGHNLGLHHGGGDDLNYKPNYLSIMNYTFAATGLKIDGALGALDYSQYGPPLGGPLSDPVLAPLDESALDEAAGFGTSSSWLARHSAYTWCAAWQERRVGPGIDWNCDAKLASSSADVNHDGAKGTLATQDDWAHLVFDGGTVGDGSSAAPSPLPLRTEPQERPASELLAIARAVTGDSRRPRVKITGRTRGTRRVRLTIRATDNTGVQLVAVQTDKGTRTYLGKGRRSVTVHVTVSKRGRHRVRAVALDRAGNNGRSRLVTVRVGR